MDFLSLKVGIEVVSGLGGAGAGAEAVVVIFLKKPNKTVSYKALRIRFVLSNVTIEKPKFHE